MGVPVDHLTTITSISPAPPLPPETPLAMPEQDLRRYDRRGARRLPADRRARAMRLALVLGSIALTAWFAVQMHQVLAVGGLVALEAVMLGLFVVNIGWIGFNTRVGPARPLRATPARRRPDRPDRRPRRHSAADLQRGPDRRRRRRRRHPRGHRGARRGRPVRSVRPERHQPPRRLAVRTGGRRPRARRASISRNGCSIGTARSTARERSATSPTGSSAGAGPIRSCSCSTPTA